MALISAPNIFMSDDEFDEHLKNTAIVRHAKKILSFRDNAIFLSDLAKEHGSAAAFFANWPVDDLVGLWEVMKKRGSRLGGATGQYSLRFPREREFYSFAGCDGCFDQRRGDRKARDFEDGVEGCSGSAQRLEGGEWGEHDPDQPDRGDVGGVKWRRVSRVKPCVSI